MKPDEARTMHFQHQNSNSFRFAIKGQFHKAKRFVITKIVFVITNVCNFYFTKSTFCILQFTNSKSFYKFVYENNVRNTNELNPRPTGVFL